MAVDKAIDSTEFDSKLTTVADAIRTAGGTTATMSFPTGMVDAISPLSSGGGGTEELSALLKIFGCSDYEISVVQRTSGSYMYIPITNETLKSSLRLILIPGTDSLFPTSTVKKAPILRAPSTFYVNGFFAYMLPFVFHSQSDYNTTMAVNNDGYLSIYRTTAVGSFTNSSAGFQFTNNILTVHLGFLLNNSEADPANMAGMKVLLMGGNVQ